MKLTDPTLHPGTMPGPPTRAAPMLETIAPYRLGITMTSNCWGLATNCIELRGTWSNQRLTRYRPKTYVLSTIMSLKAIPDDLYSSATRRKVLRNKPSPSFMMLALWTQVTFCPVTSALSIVNDGRGNPPCGCSSRQSRRRIEQYVQPWHGSKFSNSRRHRGCSDVRGQSTLPRCSHG